MLRAAVCPWRCGHDPVFDADALAGEPIRPARNVAGREDARDARFQVLVHSDAAIDGEAGLFGQCNRRPYADADDDEIGREVFSALQGDAALVDRGGCRAEMERHTVFFMEFADEIPDLRCRESSPWGMSPVRPHAHRYCALEVMPPPRDR